MEFSANQPAQWRIPNPMALAPVALAVAAQCQPGMAFGLQGPLGAGKTTWVQALCQALGVTDAVTSPSFAYLHHYAAAHYPVCHADLYRADPVDRIVPELLATLTEQTYLMLIEWADLWPQGQLWLTGQFTLQPATDPDQPNDLRTLHYTPINP
jgi:tRNA threonylcarbamoyladenosine biosynthesis protein TsaE